MNKTEHKSQIMSKKNITSKKPSGGVSKLSETVSGDNNTTENESAVHLQAQLQETLHSFNQPGVKAELCRTIVGFRDLIVEEGSDPKTEEDRSMDASKMSGKKSEISKGDKSPKSSKK